MSCVIPELSPPEFATFRPWRPATSAKNVPRMPPIVSRAGTASTDRRTPLIEDLCNQGESPASIFLPLCYLLAMDVISINSDWTKAWLNDHVRVPPPRRAAAVKLFPPPGRRKSGPV